MPEKPARSVEWTGRALRDLFEAWEFIAFDDLGAANALDERVRAATVTLAAFPYLGRIGRRRGSREFPVSRTSYTLIYRLRGERVQVLRVLHQRRKFPSGTLRS